MNNNDKVFQYNETRNALRMQKRDKNNEQIFRKINNKIKEDNQKIEKND